MKVKYSHIFWGSMFILIGLLFFVKQFTIVNLDFQFIKNLWPIFIIAIGLFYFNLPKFLNYIISSTSGLLLGLMIFSFFNHETFYKFEFTHTEYKDTSSNLIPQGQNYKFPLDSSNEEYNLDIDFGAGELKFMDFSQDLFEIATSKPFDLFDIEFTDSLKHQISISANNDVNFKNKKMEREGIIKLNPDRIINLEIDLGAVSSNFDFSNNKIKNLDINTGASSVFLKMGEKIDTSNIHIECGASKVEILVPFNSGCQITANTSLSKNKFKDFKMISDELYQSENFDKSNKKVFIHLEGGVSTFIVKRY